MDMILVRYAEVGLKSRTVRSRFERMLMDNMMSILAHDGIEAIVRCDQGRIFVEASDIDRAIPALRRVFGIASVSPAMTMGSDMAVMREAVGKYSRDALKDGQTFKVEARRTGTHPYTSMDAARDIGEAVLMANEDRNIRVNVHKPDSTIYVEIRENVAYAFSDYEDGPGGLPMGSQGKVFAYLEKEQDALAAWLVLRRGCRCIGIGVEGPATEILRKWDPEMRLVDGKDMDFLIKRYNALATVYGHTLRDMEKIKGIKSPLPTFFPLIGLSDESIEKGLEAIKAGIPPKSLL